MTYILEGMLSRVKNEVQTKLDMRYDEVQTKLDMRYDEDMKNRSKFDVLLAEIISSKKSELSECR